MLFSIIIPVYNRSELLKATLKSIVAQDYNNFEVLVVDDGSTEDITSVVNSFSDERLLYIKQANKERGAARNTGTKAAKGHYVSFIDSDDYVYPFYLSDAKKRIEQLKLPEVFVSNYEIKTDDTVILKNGFNPALTTLNNNLIENGNVVSCSGIMLRKDIALNNLFSENRTLSGSEDYELWLRLACKYPINCSPKIAIAIIQHPQRSVVTMNAQKLIDRQLTFLQLVSNNPQFYAVFPDGFPALQYEAYSYIALHLALAKTKPFEIVRFLFKSLWAKPIRLFRKRTSAIIKHLLLFPF